MTASARKRESNADPARKVCRGKPKAVEKSKGGTSTQVAAAIRRKKVHEQETASGSESGAPSGSISDESDNVSTRLHFSDEHALTIVAKPAHEALGDFIRQDKVACRERRSQQELDSLQLMARCQAVRHRSSGHSREENRDPGR